MAEPIGAVAAQHRATEGAVQDAYRGFIVHTQQCAECRTQGVDCAAAAVLRQTWRDAKDGASG